MRGTVVQVLLPSSRGLVVIANGIPTVVPEKVDKPEQRTVTLPPTVKPNSLLDMLRLFGR